jgi:tetratricopeptide (TPR) repeat protein
MRFVSLFAISALLALSPSLSAAVDLATARDLYSQQRYAEAQTVFEQIVGLEPDHATALLFLGRLARKRQDLDRAVAYLKQARDVLPDDPEILFEFGSTSSLYAESQGMSLGAAFAARSGRAAMERAVELAPENIDYRQALLEFYAFAPGIVGGNLRKAYAQADAIAARDTTRGTYARGNLLVQEKRFDEALAIWRGMRVARPDDYWVLYQLGRTLAVAERTPAEGIAALGRCLTLPRPEGAPGPSRVNWYLGQLHRLSGDIDAARTAFRTALAIEPHNFEIATDLARLPAD